MGSMDVYSAWFFPLGFMLYDDVSYSNSKERKIIPGFLRSPSCSLERERENLLHTLMWIENFQHAKFIYSNVCFLILSEFLIQSLAMGKNFLSVIKDKWYLYYWKEVFSNLLKTDISSAMYISLVCSIEHLSDFLCTGIFSSIEDDFVQLDF